MVRTTAKEVGKCSLVLCSARENEFVTDRVSLCDNIGSEIMPVKIKIILFIVLHKMNDSSKIHTHALLS